MKARLRSAHALIVSCALLMQLTGCALYGPGITRTSHLAYNEAVQASAQQELLLNLVRLRYADAPEFLAISSISAQMNFDVAASISGEVGEVEDANSAFVTPGASVGYSERPTVSFTPERGAEFTRQLVAPIELDSIYLLSQYGWDIGRVLRVTTRELNGMRNIVGREDLDRQSADELREFANVANLIGKLHERTALKLSAVERRTEVSAPLSVERVSAADLLAATKAGFRYVYRDDPPSYVLTETQQFYVLDIAEAARTSPELEALAELLKLDPALASYELDRAGVLAEAAEGRQVRIETRSILGAMAYLSNAVEVPLVDLERGLVNRSTDIESALSDLLRIRVADEAPAGTTLAVAHRGHWFFIDEADLSSRRTMGLLTSLIRLEISTGGAQNVPVLTLPISR